MTVVSAPHPAHGHHHHHPTCKTRLEMSSTKQPSAGGNTPSTTTTADTKPEEKSQSQGFSLEEDDEFEDFPVEGESGMKEGRFLGENKLMIGLANLCWAPFRLGRTRYGDGGGEAEFVGGELGR